MDNELENTLQRIMGDFQPESITYEDEAIIHPVLGVEIIKRTFSTRSKTTWHCFDSKVPIEFIHSTGNVTGFPRKDVLLKHLVLAIMKSLEKKRL